MSTSEPSAVTMITGTGASAFIRRQTSVPGHPRQHQIEKDEVRRAFSEPAKSVGSVLGELDLVTLVPEADSRASR